MREIKFRAWCKIYNYMINDFISWCLNNFKSSYNPWEDENYIKEQYTGLKDKNGVEIYEGDIFFYPEHYDCDYKIKSMNYFIVFECGGFFACNEKNNNWLGIDYKEFEIIGNIHENQELLEK